MSTEDRASPSAKSQWIDPVEAAFLEAAGGRVEPATGSELMRVTPDIGTIARQITGGSVRGRVGKKYSPKSPTKATQSDREPGDDTDVIAAERKANREARKANGKPIYDTRLKQRAAEKALGVLVRAIDDLNLNKPCKAHFEAIYKVIQGA